MGVGHVAVAIGATRVAPRVNVGWLVFAALLADFLLGIFAYLGFEHATIPDGYASKHYLLFTFPYSHGLLPLILWGTIFGLLVSWPQASMRSRAFVLTTALVLSHFILDGLVHVAGLPIFVGQNSPRLGIGLWRNMPLEFSARNRHDLYRCGALLESCFGSKLKPLWSSGCHLSCCRPYLDAAHRFRPSSDPSTNLRVDRIPDHCEWNCLWFRLETGSHTGGTSAAFLMGSIQTPV